MRPKKRKNKFTVFTRLHPLKVNSYLKLSQFDTVFFNSEFDTKILEKESMVVLLLSLLEVYDFFEVLKNKNIHKVRLVVFSNKKELNLFPKIKSLVSIDDNNEITTFIPHPFILKNNLELSMSWPVESTEQPIKDLEASINFSRRLRKTL